MKIKLEIQKQVFSGFGEAEVGQDQETDREGENEIKNGNLAIVNHDDKEGSYDDFKPLPNLSEAIANYLNKMNL
jgi:hypothetical protein